MLFILVCLALTLLVIAAICLPLLSGMSALPARGQYDRAVYRDQLREVERDIGRGVLSPEDARRGAAGNPAAAARGRCASVASGASRVASRSPALMAVRGSLFILLAPAGCTGGSAPRRHSPTSRSRTGRGSPGRCGIAGGGGSANAHRHEAGRR